MIKNKRGLSAVVTTLMIILLVLIAVGIVWVVVKNIVEGGAEDIDIGAKCLGVDLSIKSAAEAPADTFTIVVERGADDAELAGIKLVFSDENEATNIVEEETTNADDDLLKSNIPSLETKTFTIVSGDLETNFDPVKVEVVPYFTGSSGEEQLCDKMSLYTIA